MRRNAHVNRTVGLVAHRLEAQHIRRRHAAQDFDDQRSAEHLSTAELRGVGSEIEAPIMVTKFTGPC